MSVTTYRNVSSVQLVPRAMQDEVEHRGLLADAVNSALMGKINALLTVTLTANSATTDLSGPGLTGGSFLGFMPMTAHAAADIGAGTLYVSSQGKQTATLTHANNAFTDRTFRVIIIG